MPGGSQQHDDDDGSDNSDEDEDEADNEPDSDGDAMNAEASHSDDDELGEAEECSDGGQRPKGRDGVEGADNSTTECRKMKLWGSRPRSREPSARDSTWISFWIF